MDSQRSIGGFTFNSREPRERKRATRGPQESQPSKIAEERDAAIADCEYDPATFIQIPIGRYSYEDHTADIRIKSQGASIGSCLKALGLGLFNYMTDIKLVQERQARKIVVTEQQYDSFVFHYLDELLALYGDSYFMVCRIEFSRLTFEDGFHVEAICFGERFNQSIHTQGTEIKAITMHDFHFHEISKEEFELTVLVDI